MKIAAWIVVPLFALTLASAHVATLAAQTVAESTAKAADKTKDGHAVLALGGVTFRARYPGSFGNVTLRFTVRIGSNVLGGITDPITKVLKLDKERFDKWRKVGAKPSGTLAAIREAL